MLLIYPEQHFCMTLNLILFWLRGLIILCFRVFRFGSHISGIPYIIRTHFLAVLISGEVCFSGKASCILCPELEAASV